MTSAVDFPLARKKKSFGSKKFSGLVFLTSDHNRPAFTLNTRGRLAQLNILLRGGNHALKHDDLSLLF